MNAEQLLQTIKTASGKDYLEAIALSRKPQFKSLSDDVSGFWPEPKRYFQAFQKTWQSFKVNKIKPLQICEENLEKLLLPFASKDELRPPMQGFFIDGNNIVSTDCHKLAILPNFTSLANGIFQFNKLVKEPTTEKYITYSDSRYPDYKAVIPHNNPIQKSFDIQGLRKVLTLAKKWKLYQYTENVGNKVTLKINDTIFAVNGNFLLDVVTLFEQLNQKTVIAKFSEPNRAILFEVGRITVLLMPVVLEETEETELLLNLSDFFQSVE
jgi:hypothetical protein